MNPGGPNKPQCFAVRRGEIHQRLDCHYNLPQYRLLVESLLANFPAAPRLDTYGTVSCGPFGTAMKTEDYTQRGVPLIRIGNITGYGTIDETDIVFLSEPKASSLRSTQVRPGDLVISQRGTLGIPAIVPPSYPIWNISANIIAVKDLVDISPQYLQLFLSSRFGVDQLRRSQSGQVQEKITTEDVASVLIPKVANESELVTQMESARLAYMEKSSEAEALTSEIDSFLLEQLGLSSPVEDERRYFGIRLGQMKGHRFDPPAYRPYYRRDEKPAIQITPLRELADINSHTVVPPQNMEELVPYVGLPECDLTEVREVVMRPYKEVKGRSIVREGDILFARIEPSVFNKKYVLVDNLKGHEYAYTSTEFYVATPKEDINLLYLYAMFSCSFVFSQTIGKTTGSSGRRRIDLGLFATLRIPDPGKERQALIAGEVLRRRTTARYLRGEAEREWRSAKARFEAQLLSQGGQKT